MAKRSAAPPTDGDMAVVKETLQMMPDQFESAYYAVVPADVRYDPDLTPNAKLLYGELTSLCSQKGYCWATNDYFARLYGMSPTSISRLISQLEKKGYICCEMAATDKGSQRRIYAGIFLVRQGQGGVAKKVKTPLDEDDQGGLNKTVKAGVFLVRQGQGGVAKNVNTPLDKNDKGGLSKNVKQNNKNIIINTPYSPPQGDEPSRGKKKSRPTPDWELFERFWQAYPKRKAKDRARRAWAKLTPDLALCKVMSDALERDKQSPQWRKDGGAYIPYPATWLNGHRWEDETDLPGAAPDPAQPGPLRGEGVRYL